MVASTVIATLVITKYFGKSKQDTVSETGNANELKIVDNFTVLSEHSTPDSESSELLAYEVLSAYSDAYDSNDPDKRFDLYEDAGIRLVEFNSKYPHLRVRVNR